MQKVIGYYKPDGGDLNMINKELANGWTIKMMTSVESSLIVLYEKFDRKEKLEALNNLNNK